MYGTIKIVLRQDVVNKMNKWCQTVIKNYWYMWETNLYDSRARSEYVKVYFMFDEESDLAAFKLTWNDEFMDGYIVPGST